MNIKLDNRIGNTIDSSPGSATIMFCFTSKTGDGVRGANILWLLFLLCFGVVWACLMQSTEEDLWHFVPETWSEACHAAGMSWLFWNARLGEMACYFVGSHFRLWVLVLQPLCLVLTVFSLYRLAIGEWPSKHRRHTGITLLFIFLAVLAMHSGLDWFNGNCSWFYPCSFALFFFALVEPIFYGRFSMPWKKFFLLLPMAVIVGMSNEATSLASLLFFGGAGVYYKTRNKAAWGSPYTILLLVLAISAALLYCAPAGAARREAADSELSLWYYLQSFTSLSSWLYFPICFWRLFLIGGILLLWEPRTNALLLRRRYLLVGAAFMMMWGILIMAPAWGAPRGYCPMELALIIILTALFYAKIEASQPRSIYAILSVHLIIMLTQIVPTSIMVWERHVAWSHLVEAADQAKQRGETKLVVRDASDFYKEPVKQLWKLPHSFYPYKSRVDFLLIPSPVDHAYMPYFEVSLTNWRDGGQNRTLAKRLGLEQVIFIKPE